MGELLLAIAVLFVAVSLLGLVISYKPKTTTSLSNSVPKPHPWPSPPDREIEFTNLDLGPNDVLVVHCDRFLSETQRNQLLSNVKIGLVEGLIIVEGGVFNFQVIRRGTNG